MKTLNQEKCVCVSGGFKFTGELCDFNNSACNNKLSDMQGWSGVALTGFALLRHNEAGQCEMLFYPTDTQTPFHFTGEMPEA